jgi:hypothetical protein
MKHWFVGAGIGGGPDIAVCIDRFQRLNVVSDLGVAFDPRIGGDDPAALGAMVAFVEEQRVAVNLVDSIGIFDVASSSVTGSVHLVEQLTPQDAGLGDAAAFVDLFRDGAGLLIYARRGEAAENDVFLSWQPDQGFEELTRSPEGAGFQSGQLADAEHGIVVGLGRSLYRAQRVGDDWSWEGLGVVQERSIRPLAFDGDDLLVGIREESRFEEGAGGAGGSGGEGGQASSGAARVERWNLAGEVLQSYEVLGDPSAAVPARGGWLIAQTNSFWGSYRAAVDWLNPEGELVRLSEVPVQSSGDGTDGAYDVATHGDQLLVANCESGLRRGAWATDEAVELTDVPGPWSPGDSTCHPSELEVVGDVLVIGGERLDFVRLCESAE